MKNTSKLLVFVIIFAVLNACKSDFEKIRTSSDPVVLLENADKYFEEEDYQKAQSLYELVMPSYRGKKELEDIYYKYAYTYYYLRSFILAAYYFENFSSTFPTSPLREEIDFMGAYSNYQLSPSFRLDQQYTIKAINDLQLFVNTYPTSERVGQANTLIDELRKKLEEKAYDAGRLYADMEQYQSAMQSFENLLKDFPETQRAEQIRYEIIISSFKLAQNSIVQKQIERYEEAYELSEVFLRKYESSKSAYWNEIKTINKRIEQTLNKIRKDDRYKIQSTIN